MKTRPVQKVKGTICTNWAGHSWAFRLVSGVRWDYDRGEHVLFCRGETVASGIMCLGDAILFAQGYESGVSDIVRKGNGVLTATGKRDYPVSCLSAVEDFWKEITG